MHLAKHLVVVPAFNEEPSLSTTLKNLQALPETFELLVVNDGSTDATSEVAHVWQTQSRLPLHVVDLSSNCGIGAAVQTGYLFALQQGTYYYVLQIDADGQHDVSSALSLLEYADRHQLDLCVGSRFMPGRGGKGQSTVARRIGSRCLASLIRMLTRTIVTDPTSGLRCAAPRAWRAFAALYPDDYPEPESLYWCIRNGLRVGEYPVRMHDRIAGQSSIQSLAQPYYMLKVSLAIVISSLRTKDRLQHVC